MKALRRLKGFVSEKTVRDESETQQSEAVSAHHEQGVDPWVKLRGLQCCPEQCESFSAKHKRVN